MDALLKNGMCETGDEDRLYPVVEGFETDDRGSHTLHDADIWA